MTQSLPKTVALTTSDERIRVEIRPYSIDTRWCPTTRDAIEVSTYTHCIYSPDRDFDYIVRGTLAYCENWILSRQTSAAALHAYQVEMGYRK